MIVYTIRTAKSPCFVLFPIWKSETARKQVFFEKYGFIDEFARFYIVFRQKLGMTENKSVKGLISCCLRFGNRKQHETTTNQDCVHTTGAKGVSDMNVGRRNANRGK